jgi:hypothetical protein
VSEFLSTHVERSQTLNDRNDTPEAVNFRAPATLVERLVADLGAELRGDEQATPNTGRQPGGSEHTASTTARGTPRPLSLLRRVAERTIDIPIGVALLVRDRISDAVQPWAQQTTREKELKSLRTQVARELNKFERRGGRARRKASQRVRSTRIKVEREAKAGRREVEKTVVQNRREAEVQLKKARTARQQGVEKVED